jgi:uncharacterized membrane protein
MVSLGGSDSRAFGVSADGSVIVGTSKIPGGEPQNRAVRWTSSGMTILSAPGLVGVAKDVSADGSLVVGRDNPPTGCCGEAVLWTTSGTEIRLGDLPGGYFDSWGEAISADASVVVGQAWGDSGADAMRWTQESGMVGLGCSSVFPVVIFCNATDVSADGSVVVGWRGAEAFRWTAEGGLTTLGPGDPQAVSADGSVVVGNRDGKAFIWDEISGMRDLQDVLTTDLSLDLTGWTLLHASDVSADGLTIVGQGINPSGEREAWIAALSVPEPTTALLLATGLAGLAWRVRRVSV